MASQAHPAVPPNPLLILLDSDVVFQIFLADQIPTLLHIKRKYHIQPMVVEAVDVEIRKNKKFRGRFDKVYQKSVDHETVLILDARSLPAFVTSDARSVYESIQSTGLRYNLFMDYGESYTHAAAVILRAPVVSNDHNALRVAQKNGLDIQEPVLGTFDLVVFALQTGHLNDRDCEEIRKKLLAAGEPVYAAFKHRSFRDGLPNFYARLTDISIPAIGSPSPKSKWDQRISVLLQ